MLNFQMRRKNHLWIHRKRNQTHWRNKMQNPLDKLSEASDLGPLDRNRNQNLPVNCKMSTNQSLKALLRKETCRQKQMNHQMNLRILNLQNHINCQSNLRILNLQNLSYHQRFSRHQIMNFRHTSGNSILSKEREIRGGFQYFYLNIKIIIIIKMKS